jgi:hypothetical protein
VRLGALQGAAGSGIGSALIGLGNNPYVQQGLNQYFNPPQTPVFSDAYQASIPGAINPLDISIHKCLLVQELLKIKE